MRTLEKERTESFRDRARTASRTRRRDKSQMNFHKHANLLSLNQHSGYIFSKPVVDIDNTNYNDNYNYHQNSTQ